MAHEQAAYRHHPLDAEAPTVADQQADLRDRIAAALLARIKWATVSKTQPHDAVTSLLAATEYDLADAVLAVLPPPADRAAVLREAADIAEDVAIRLHRAHDVGGSLGAYEAMAELRRLAAEAPQPEGYEATTGHLITCLAVAGGSPDPDCSCAAKTKHREVSDETRPLCACGRFWPCALADAPAVPVQPAADGWRGATELVPDREVQRLAATGLVGYQQDRGRLLHCLHHKPAPASRYVDFQEVTAEDLPEGGICVHPSCGADLLAVQPVAADTGEETDAIRLDEDGRDVETGHLPGCASQSYPDPGICHCEETDRG
jgi:hypothetical protein